MRVILFALFLVLFVAVFAEKSPATSTTPSTPSYSSSTKCATTSVNVRSSASTSGSVLRTLSRGQQVSVSSTSNGWSQIGSGQYVSAQYLGSCGSAPAPYNPPAPVYSPPSSGSGQAQNAVAWARSKVGGCYSQTNRDGNPCYDCSSLVYYAWRAAGKNIGATNTRMYPGNTRSISASQLQPGDLLWRSGHVGMFIGNGRFVHAKGKNYGILEENFNAGSWTKFYRP